MKFIDQSVELIPTPENQWNSMEVLKFIERIGRICYRSENMITDESCVKFVDMLRRLGHYAMLEHYHFHCIMDRRIAGSIFSVIDNTSPYVFEIMSQIPAEKILHIDPETYYSGIDKNGSYYLISFSATTILKRLEWVKDSKNFAIDAFRATLKAINPVLFGDLPVYYNHTVAMFVDGIYFPKHRKFLDIHSYDEYNKLERNIDLNSILHNTMTVLFTTDRGITHSIVRHRPASYAMESTIYCRYNKDKFGNEITYIKTPEVDQSPEAWEIYKASLQAAEDAYMKLIDMGYPSKITRCVLPHAVAAKLVMTASDAEWLHFFKTRCSDPKDTSQIREVANMAKDIFEKERNMKLEDYQHLIDIRAEEFPTFFV